MATTRLEIREWHWIEAERADGSRHVEWCFATAALAGKRALVNAGHGGRVAACYVRDIPEHARINGWRDGDPPRSYQG